MIGTKLASYEIMQPLGKGGMGEVYLAKDTRLDRDVAIKVLPDAMARNTERILRFEREAKLLASLNHSTIAQIYGFEESDGKKFLVLEYVEGDTLTDRLDEGPLLVEDALEFCEQVAEALEAAHEKGVIHRDLKPSNVMVKPDGTVKVLDFGLARAMQEGSSCTDIQMNSPTITADYTKPGVVLGTAPYMSPEQARGRQVDKRTDIWSFGVLLYECLTGQSLFHGETATDSMGAIMHREPDWTMLPPGTPPTVHLLLRRCLTKDRKRRLHDIADARIELEGAIEDPNSTSLGIASVALAARDARRRWPALIPWTLATVGILVAALSFWRPWVGREAPPEPQHLSITAPDGFEFHNYDISPDGLSIAYCMRSLDDEEEEDDVKYPLQLRHLNQPDPIAIRGTEGGHRPQFSPSGEWLAYTNGGDLFRVRLDGRPPMQIARREDFRRIHAWFSDDEFIITKNANELALLSANDGSIKPITQENDSPGMSFLFDATPTPIPNTLLTNTFRFGEGPMTRNLELFSLEKNSATSLIDNSWKAMLTPSDCLLFTRDESLLGVRFDAERGEVFGDVTALLAGVGDFRYVPTGTLLHGGQAGPNEDSTEIVLVSDETCVPAMPNAKKRDYQGFSISPDGRYITANVFSFDGGTPRIWLIDLDSGIEQPLTPADQPSTGGVWSPDGSRIAYSVINRMSIEVVPVDGSSEPEALFTSDSSAARLFVVAWPPGDSILLANRFKMAEDQSDIVLLSLQNEEIRTVLDSAATERVAALSPDGEVLAYWSDVSGDNQLYLQRIDLEKGLVGVRRRVVMRKTFRNCHWSQDGTALLGIDGDGQMWSASVSTEPELAVAPVEKLIDFTAFERLTYNQWAPLPNDQGFLFLRDESEDSKLTELHIVMNFQTMLDRALP
ncbi:MAG: protein kinase domain-containing protein [Planctomycetota bacterium]|jgi:serine/threonine protein kinase